MFGSPSLSAFGEPSTVCSDGKFGDAEGEVQVPHPMVGEAYRDHARSFTRVLNADAFPATAGDDRRPEEVSS